MVDAITWARLDPNHNCFIETDELKLSVGIFNARSSADLIPLVQEINAVTDLTKRRLLLDSLARIICEAFASTQNESQRNQVITKATNLLAGLEANNLAFVLKRMDHILFVLGDVGKDGEKHNNLHAGVVARLQQKYPRVSYRLQRAEGLPIEPHGETLNATCRSEGELPGPDRLVGNAISFSPDYWRSLASYKHISIGEWHAAEGTTYFLASQAENLAQAGISYCVLEEISDEAQGALDELYVQHLQGQAVVEIQDPLLLSELARWDHDPRRSAAQYDLILSLVNAGIRVVVGDTDECFEIRNERLAEMVDGLLQTDPSARVLVYYGAAHNDLGPDGYIDFLESADARNVYRIDVVDRGVDDREHERACRRLVPPSILEIERTDSGLFRVAQVHNTEALSRVEACQDNLYYRSYVDIHYPGEKQIIIQSPQGNHKADEVVVLGWGFSPFHDED